MFAIKFCVHSLAEQGISVNAEQLLKVENAVKVDALEKMADKKKGLPLDSPPQYLPFLIIIYCSFCTSINS